MIEFEKKFIETQGKPFSVAGTEYRMVLQANSGMHHGFRIKFGKCIVKPRQGIRIDCESGLNCRGKQGPAFELWNDTVPEQVVIACPCHADISIRNVWDNGDGVVHSWHAGGAMVVEQDGTTIRIRGNSTLQNDLCEDLHAELVWLDEIPVPSPNDKPRSSVWRKIRSLFCGSSR